MIKSLLAKGSIRVTFSALACACQFGLDFQSLIEIVAKLSPEAYYKSLVTVRDSTIWQDVYRPFVNGLEFYLKIVVINEML